MCNKVEKCCNNDLTLFITWSNGKIVEDLSNAKMFLPNYNDFATKNVPFTAATIMPCTKLFFGLSVGVNHTGDYIIKSGKVIYAL